MMRLFHSEERQKKLRQVTNFIFIINFGRGHVTLLRNDDKLDIGKTET